MHSSRSFFRLTMKIRSITTLTCLVYITIFGRRTAADDWQFFRGPHQNGISQESGWQTRWPKSGPKIPWRRDLGIGASSTVVVGNRVVSMGNINDEDVVWCLDANSGNVLWKHSYPCKFVDHNFEGGTSSTPTIDGTRVYTLAYDGQVFCLDLKSGDVIWQKHLVKDFEGRYSSWDYAGSPLVKDEMVIFDTGADGRSTVALDKTSGQLIWGVGNDLAGYATPITFDFDGVPGVLVFKARALVAHRLDSGQELWRVGWKTNYDVNASTPTVLENRLFISSGYGGRRARGALFELTKPKPTQIWVNDDIETKMNSAVVHDGHVYCLSERAGGRVMCVDLSNGKTVWKESSFSPYGALIIADGKLIILDEDGDVVIAQASSEGYRELARCTVHTDRCWAMPVLANGRIYVRSNKGNLACLDVRTR